jgi:hypothetical protein
VDGGGGVTSVERLQRSRLGSLDLIGKGGQARVYLAPELKVPGTSGPLVFKEYRRKTISINGLDGMTAFRLRLEGRDRSVLDAITNWPVRVVEGSAGADGVVLPLIPPEFFHELHLPAGARKRRPRDGQYLAQPPERCQRVGVPVAGLGDRYRFCRDLAFAIGFLHRRDVCVGDISFANVSYSFDYYPCVYLVDCDGFRLRGHAAVVPQLHTPDWVPPEGARVQSTSTDLYKLGLYILRVLTPVPLSAQNRDPSWADGALEPRGRVLLRRALADDAARRTSAKEWYEHFDGVLKRRRLRTSTHRRRIP